MGAAESGADVMGHKVVAELVTLCQGHSSLTTLEVPNSLQRKAFSRRANGS